MVKKVKITIDSKQRLHIPEPEDEENGSPLVGDMSSRVESEGELEYEDGVFCISYPESEVTGMEGSVTSVTFSDKKPGSVSIYRSGPVKTVMMFAEGQRYIAVYDTGFGSFEVGIVTLCCDNRISELGGELHITYIVEIKGSEAEHTELEINVRCIE